eukprot:TRINITY_DN2137_c0_g1_i3.p1 TRINITY_DN2137_c0_g1~~TRINITY_DN2137_c0_g1_i3.p1  ORF type:complete len:290 (+),score=41.42 TRINITY_DN2137_c0_g1_i3:47-871(+)
MSQQEFESYLNQQLVSSKVLTEEELDKLKMITLEAFREYRLKIRDIIDGAFPDLEPFKQAMVYSTISKFLETSSLPSIPSSISRIRKEFPFTRYNVGISDKEECTNLWLKVHNTNYLNKITWDKYRKNLLYEPFESFLKIILGSDSKLNVWRTKSANDRGKEFIPDLVVHESHSFDIFEDKQLKNVVLDIEMKRRFQPIKSEVLYNDNGKEYPGKLADGYRQMLQRSVKTFQCSDIQTYCGIVTDMESIVFIEVQRDPFRVYLDGEYPLGWTEI